MSISDENNDEDNIEEQTKTNCLWGRFLENAQQSQLIDFNRLNDYTFIGGKNYNTDQNITTLKYDKFNEFMYPIDENGKRIIPDKSFFKNEEKYNEYLDEMEFLEHIEKYNTDEEYRENAKLYSININNKIWHTFKDVYVEEFERNFPNHKLPAQVDKCICGTHIKLCCFITLDNDYNKIITIGRECIEKFKGANLKCIRTCKDCKLKNVKRHQTSNVCNDCKKIRSDKIKKIKQIIKKDIKEFKKEQTQKQIIKMDNEVVKEHILILNIPFSKKNIAKKFKCFWDVSIKKWCYKYYTYIPDELKQFM